MSNPSKNTLVLGASDNPTRYSYMAINRLRDHGHTVSALGRKEMKIGDVEIVMEKKDFPAIHTITLYLSPGLQKQYYGYILSLHPRRVIFNPGTENHELADLVRKEGIEPLEACTMVLLSTGQY